MPGFDPGTFLDQIELDAPPRDVVFEMSKVVANYYLHPKLLNIRPVVEFAAKTNVAAAIDARGVIDALKYTFGSALEQAGMSGAKLFQPLHDLAENSRNLPTT